MSGRVRTTGRKVAWQFSTSITKPSSRWFLVSVCIAVVLAVPPFASFPSAYVCKESAMLKGLAITPPAIGRIFIGKIAHSLSGIGGGRDQCAPRHHRPLRGGTW